MATGDRDSRILAPLVALAAPMLLGQAGQVLLQLTDTIMVGQLGAIPLAGASLAGNFVMFALYFAYGSIGAVAPRVAQAFGARDRAGITAAGRAGLVLAVLVGLVIAVTLTALVPLLGFLGQPPEVVAVTGSYLALIAWSLPGAMIALVLSQTAEALNRPWPVLGFMGVSVALNAFLNWLLIFGHWGLPALGLDGAGWATLIARWAHAGLMLLWVTRDRELGAYGFLRRAAGMGAALRDLVREGLPIAGQDVLEGGSFALGSIMLGWVGTVALAANQVTISIASLAWMVPMAMATATGVRVAHAAGAGDLRRARATGLAGVGIGVAVMAGCAVVYVTSGSFFTHLFTNDEDVARLAGVLVTIAGIYQISDAIQSVSLGALRGLLDNRVPLIANAICYWVLSLPTLYLLAFILDWGAVGIWIGYLPWMALTGLFFLARFLRRTRA